MFILLKKGKKHKIVDTFEIYNIFSCLVVSKKMKEKKIANSAFFVTVMSIENAYLYIWNIDMVQKRVINDARE